MTQPGKVDIQMSWLEAVKGDDFMASIDFKCEMLRLSFHHSVWSIIRLLKWSSY